MEGLASYSIKGVCGTQWLAQGFSPAGLGMQLCGRVAVGSVPTAVTREKKKSAFDTKERLILLTEGMSVGGNGKGGGPAGKEGCVFF